MGEQREARLETARVRNAQARLFETLKERGARLETDRVRLFLLISTNLVTQFQSDVLLKR